MARLRFPRARLPLTAVSVLLLLALPAWQLQRQPRPRAQGLERVLALADLIQSFSSSPGAPVPPLWRERLGVPLAERLWRAQRGSWWQLWSRNGEGQAVLVLPAATLAAVPPRQLPPQRLTVDDLLLVAPDPLTRHWLAEQTRSRPRQPRGLERSCLQRLAQGQAVFWRPSAVAAIAGPLAPLLQRFQEGCVDLRLGGAALQWRGEAASSAGVLAEALGSSTPAAAPPAPAAALPPQVWLELEGSSLDLVLEALLGRQLIREPLASRYGFGPAQLQLLRQAPFRLRVLALPQGPFQASLELQLAVGNDRAAWIRILTALRQALEEQGLQAAPSPGVAPLPTATWTRDDGAVVGGWRWVTVRGGAPELQFFLGPPPRTAQAEAAVSPAIRTGAPAAAPVQLDLRLRPQELERRGLLPPGLPEVIRKASRLEASAEAGRSGRVPDPVSRLTGRLDLNP
ncbi:MAG: hypothetical protein ACKO5F_11930 [Synechococcus sp.]